MTYRGRVIDDNVSMQSFIPVGLRPSPLRPSGRSAWTR